ncbi:hypothetical protein GQX74_001110 [Glossina fuscipes]|nr:hypothetical protein GQX74_001110 [Glossina fuscipes]
MNIKNNLVIPKGLFKSIKQRSARAIAIQTGTNQETKSNQASRVNEREMNRNMSYHTFEIEAKESYCFGKNRRRDFSPLKLRSEYNIIPDKGMYVDSDYNSCSECSYCKGVDDGIKTAGLKIFAMIMCHAWRKRREQLHELRRTMEELKQGSIKAKSQLQIYNQLLRVEQKRNDELSEQVKEALNTLKNSRASYEFLSNSIANVKTDKAMLEEELKSKYEEYDALHAVLSQTKTDLFRCMMDQRNLQVQLCKEQRSVQSLENQKNKLINEICEIGSETRRVEERCKQRMEEKDQQLLENKNKANLLEIEVFELREKMLPLNSIEANNDRMKSEIESLRAQLFHLKKKLDSSLSHQIYMCWEQLLHYQKSTFQFLHVFAFYLLPAMPPPYKYVGQLMLPEI